MIHMKTKALLSLSEKYKQKIRRMAMSQLLVVFKNGAKPTD